MAETHYTNARQNTGVNDFNDIKRVLTMNTRRVQLIMSSLGPLMASMENLVEIGERYKLMLYEPQLLFSYRRDWIAFLIALRLYNKYKRERVSRDEAKKFVQQIRLHDKKLADGIESALPDVQENSVFFLELINELKNARQYFVSYIITHSKELIEKAEAMKNRDPKLSKQLVELFTAISRHEIDSLIKYKDDCEDWLNYAVGYNIDFFINRINLFLNGGYDNRNRVQFQGLYKDFGDEKIQWIILRNNAVINLRSYLNQLKYLNLLIGMCRRAYVTGDWNKGFYGPKGFWTNFDKYAVDFEKVYGNVDFKERLTAIKSKKEYELPQFWGGVWERSETQDMNELGQRNILYIVEGGVIYIMRQDGVLTKLLSELYSRRYQINNVIHPAAAALMKIFEDRDNELRAVRNQKVRDLIKLLLGMFGLPQLRKFRRLLKRKKHNLLRGLKKDISEWVNKSNDPLSEYHNIADEQEKVLGKIIPEYILQETRKIVARRNQELQFEGSLLETENFLKRYGNITEFTFTGIAEKRAAEFQAEKVSYETLWHVTEEDFQYMQSLIPRIRVIIRGLTEVYGYIITKMEQKYAIKVENLGIIEMDAEKRKNRDYKLNYVSKMLNRLI